MFGKFQHTTNTVIFFFAKVAGSVKTRDEAQAIVDVEVTAAQAAWDALSDEEKSNSSRPADITLEE